MNGDYSGVGAAGVGILLLFYWLFIIAVYIYTALALMKIAQKTGTDDGWFAWIPILNVILMLQIAEKPVWWIILLFIPIVNIVITIMVWIAIAERLGKPSWWGWLICLIPIVNFVLLGMLAWGDTEETQIPSAAV